MVDFFSKKNSLYVLKHLAIAVLIGIIVEFCKYAFNLEEPASDKMKEEFMSHFILSLIGAIIIAPIVEESIFRLPLKKNYFFPMSILILLLFISTSKYNVVIIAGILYVIGVIFAQLFNKIISLRYILIALSIASFVLVHFDNTDEKELYALDSVDLIFLFLPQLGLALVLSKVRLQTTFLNSIVLHSLYNLIILSLALLTDF
ncbi:CPBP family glutamic-type intramembrane protease [Flavobacterium gawalongense]|uniref:CPBP family intramembrane metalloprotease n=1 Tax=Flavobacterium gawalongense TaxID=2594432 RepID=A0A553BX71_9FLAO|nr:CPBP family glutamic-type intramembrane protease [Flavobacterium gawalongense]TRX04173.1 CPBP family intramembrane metalloprotease [Flavobacterium gawalongense]TRX09377.1 CPBP family intramembrane metalloprotease [Flavobacterium gawalongense]TRX12809.1 CPBP family intramembrane metalloprotease [Flavobacterium gawalongense]TRX13154.1 CPBP family intramembrane metalloprotease [Flavobacterium gawalongense]TRX30784.1 CPBP family intramembrane metalloprotease [Flavobacterium gawalongense]